MARISLLFRSKQSNDSCIWQVRGRRIQRWHSRALRCKLRGPNPRLRPSLPSVCPLFEIGLHAWCRFKKNKIMKAGNHHYSVSNLLPSPFFFLSWLVQYITGNVGILFTNREKDDVVGWFEKYGEADFARSGDKASETVTLSAGPLPQFPHSIEPHLRKLGLATSLQRGVVMLLKDTVVCTKGAALSPSEANILKLLGITMAEFHVTLTHAYNEADGVSFLQGGGGGAASA